MGSTFMHWSRSAKGARAKMQTASVKLPARKRVRPKRGRARLKRPVSPTARKIPE